MASYKCDHCGVHCSAEIATVVGNGQAWNQERWTIWKFVCPACGYPNVIVTNANRVPLGVQSDYRLTSDLGAFSDAIPSELLDAFREAREVLAISPRACSILARFILQHMLSLNGFKGRTLFDQVNRLRETEDPSYALPSSLKDSLDGIRGFGNLGAHPEADPDSGHLLNVEDGEAEWCLHVLERLFEHLYINPARDSNAMEALRKKQDKARKSRN